MITISGEKLSHDFETETMFKNKLKILIEEKGLSDDQLYNVDETGLYF